MKIHYTALILLIGALFLTSCGKKGPPVPNDQKNQIRFETAEANFANGNCLAISGKIIGNPENVASFVLELEPVLDELCLNCPFTPREQAELKAVPGAVENVYDFVYCPANEATAYRWRLVARNVYSSFAHALSRIGLVKNPLHP